jgi:hypothetical protein
MKQIDYRGGIVRFLIPESWVEEYEDAGGGTFYEDRPGCGTLRLNVITAKKPADAPDAKRALMALMDRKRPANSSLQVLGNGKRPLPVPQVGHRGWSRIGDALLGDR